MKEQSRSKKSWLLVLLILISWGVKYLLWEDRPSDVEIVEESFPKRSSINRKIASQNKVVKKDISPEYQITNNVERVYKHENEDDSSFIVEPTGHEESTSYLPMSSASGSFSSPAVTAAQKGNTPSSEITTSSSNDSTLFTNVSNPSNAVEGDAVRNRDSDTDNTHIGNDLFCSASVSDGSYSYALSVALNCSTSSTIKYCLSEGHCCDPDSSNGIVYSSSAPVLVGEQNARYCLSYYGVDSSNSHTDIFRRVYDINKTLPDLFVETPISWMQTTEVPISANINSQSFGANHFSLSQISYMSHNVGPTGDDLACDELVTQMPSYSSPSPIYTLNPLNISHLTPSQQVEVSLEPTDLSYGMNYIATNIVNNYGPVPTYACTLSQVTLMDFSFFDYAGVASANDGSLGGFTSFGFYEDFSTTVRAPAGESSFSYPDQKIEISFLSIIY